MTRKPLVAGNWKMNRTTVEAAILAQDISNRFYQDYDRVDTVLCPPFIDLKTVRTVLEFDRSPLMLGAQDVFWEDAGAFTGATSPLMLKEVGCSYCIVGHSERRELFAETDLTVGRKARALLGHGIVPIVCVGEGPSVREEGEKAAIAFVTAQLEAALRSAGLEGFEGLAGLAGLEGSGNGEESGPPEGLSLPGGPAGLEKVVVAYEPVWAIGTGRTATPEAAQAVCAAIRERLAAVVGPRTAEGARILYGGSLNAGNAALFVSQPDIDGGLVGGAALDADSFVEIVRVFL
ncbi:MAG: triose-phosphate isomerase [Coriobacteriales bacterium]|jgi:triosephosphate isomerase|nr:triose-phosphate isomerase [Coriobacteriales bacterium]